jgi:UDP-glucuronate 4-epimerase
MAMNEMHRWLVTGGVGFIGYHLSRALLARGAQVSIVDDFSDAPYPSAEKRRNASDLLAEDPRVRVHEGCITDRAFMSSVIDADTFDGVVHLAGLAGVRPSFRDPARYARVNVEGTANVIDLARARGVKKLVFASSSSIYGNATPLPAREDAPAIEPESPYAASKRGAELMAAILTKASPDVACSALRFFTVYGPRQRPEMAITLFARAVLAGKPITVFGDGSMQRDFTHVDDIVRGVLAVLDRAPNGFRAYNLGSGAPIDLAGLVRALGQAARREPVITHGPIPRGDVDATFADISRARDELGFRPHVSLTEGLATVIDWIKRNP